jgi:hypothetical protein
MQIKPASTAIVGTARTTLSIADFMSQTTRPCCPCMMMRRYRLLPLEIWCNSLTKQPGGLTWGRAAVLMACAGVVALADYGGPVSLQSLTLTLGG